MQRPPPFPQRAYVCPLSRYSVSFFGGPLLAPNFRPLAVVRTASVSGDLPPRHDKGGRTFVLLCVIPGIAYTGVVPCTYCTQVTQPSSSSRPRPSASDNLFSSGDHDYLGGNRTEACAKDSSRPFLPLLIQFSGDPSSCVPTLLPYFPFCRGGGGAKRQEMAIKILSD